MMGIENLIVFLLFILPGILAQKISHNMNFPPAEKPSDFREITSGILLSLPIVLIMGAVMAFIYDIKTIKCFVDSFDSLIFLVQFFAGAFVLAIILGITKGISANRWNGFINMIRRSFNRMAIDDKSCWRQTFLEENVARYVKILKDDKILAEGFVKHYSLPNEEMSIVLENFETIEIFRKHQTEIKERLEFCKTYVNIEKSVIIEIYDTTEAKKYLESLEQ